MVGALAFISCEQSGSHGGGGGGGASGGGGGGSSVSGTTPEEDATKLWPAQEDNGTKWGYIDASGKMAIEAQFDNVSYFSCGCARVWVDGAYKFIDKTGNVISENMPTDAVVDNYFYYNVCRYVQNDLYSFMDKNFQPLFTPKFKKLSVMSADGLAFCSEIENLYGYCDKLGEMVISPQFDLVSVFNGGVAVVGRDGNQGVLYGLINTKGDFVIDYSYTPLYNIGEGIIAFYNSNDKYGLLDNKGNEILSATFDDVYVFSEGMAIVRKDDKYGYINKKGEYAIEPMKLEYATEFSDGVAWIKEPNGGNWEVIDKTGTVILTLSSQQTAYSTFHNGLAMIWEDSQLKYINKKGDVIYTWHPGSNAPSLEMQQTEIMNQFHHEIIGNKDYIR